MVDNIDLNKTTPLLSSTERVKRVDRKRRDDQKPPFNTALKDEKKKKKKKKKRESEIPAETRNAGDSPPRRARAEKEDKKQGNKLKPDKDKKIIDIRV